MKEMNSTKSEFKKCDKETYISEQVVRKTELFLSTVLNQEIFLISSTKRLQYIRSMNNYKTPNNQLL